jgi:mannitol/fructose-specific phosphotransferase system IIA component (Ntr-type)
VVWSPALGGNEGLDFFVGHGTVYEFGATTKLDMIHALVRKLCDLGYVEFEAIHSVVHAVIHREELGSTGIGGGVAIPHAEHATIERMVGIIGHAPQGIDFGSLDRADVTRVFLLLSPRNTPGEHLRALEAISRKLQKCE